MSPWFASWLVLGGVVGLVWFVRLCMIGRALRRREIIGSGSYDSPPGDPPFISVIVAAKDEQDNIEACVTSLLEQDYPAFEVIAVDDRSRDGTPEILTRLEQHSGGKLRVITVETLREGWFGKNNAMREGVSASRGQWLLFTDADCRQTSPKTLSMAMREAIAHQADFLSITPVLETCTTWERIIQPVCALVLIFWFLPHRVNDPAKKTAYANGAFMLMSRSCYERIGGHECVKAEVNEDIQLARLAKQMGLKLRVVENDDLYRTRMYRTFGEAWRGWSRIFYGCLGSLPRLVTSASLVFLLVITPWVSLAAAWLGRAVAGDDGVEPWTLAGGVWLGVILLKQIVSWRIYTVVRVGRMWSLTYVVGAVVAFAMLISAMLKTIGVTSTTWRGTTYRGARVADLLRDGEPDFGSSTASAPPRRGRTS